MPTFGRFNQNGVLAGERGYDEPSFGAIRKKFISQFLSKYAKFVKLKNFCPFLPNLPTFGRFNQNGALAGESGYDEPSFGAIRKKFISQFLSKYAKFVKLKNFCPFLPNLPTFGRFNQNGALAGESGYDEPSFGAIRKKFISRFLRK